MVIIKATYKVPTPEDLLAEIKSLVLERTSLKAELAQAKEAERDLLRQICTVKALFDHYIEQSTEAKAELLAAVQESLAFYERDKNGLYDISYYEMLSALISKHSK